MHRIRIANLNMEGKSKIPHQTTMHNKCRPTPTQKYSKFFGSLLYYGRAVDNTVLVALNSIASQQAHAMTTTLEKVHQLLDYVATYPNATLVYTPSEMILKLQSDASYLSEPRTKSRYGGHYYWEANRYIQLQPTEQYITHPIFSKTSSPQPQRRNMGSCL